MSFFSGKNALRHQYADLVAADLATATTPATAVLWIQFQNYGRLSYIDNDFLDGGSLGVELDIYAVHPEQDPTVVANRLFWINMGGGRVINYSTGGAPGIAFDPKTRLYVSCPAGVPASGKLRIASW